MDLITKLVKLCRKNDVEGVRKCLKQKVELNMVDKYGHSPLVVAACNPETYDIAKMLIDAGADVNFQMPIAVASSFHDNVLMIKLLHEAGADINMTLDTSSALTGATLNNCPENMIYLISLGADINLTDEHGFTTLMLIAQTESGEMAKILIEHGADVNKKDNNGVTALMYAVYYKNINYARFLLQNNADVNIQDKDGDTALDYAKKNGEQELINLLLEYNSK